MITLQKVQELIHGAVRIWEEEGYFCFSRFTPAQAENHRLRGVSPREDASASMRLEFFTCGGQISFDYTVTPGSARCYYGIEAAADGKLIHNIYREANTGSGHFSCSISASPQPRRVTVYFPHSVCLRIRCLSLPDDCISAQRSRKYLALGDSITQGHDAMRPSLSYVNRLADALHAHVLNQAIGGDVFCPQNLDDALPFAPDLITVAYGTNDWNHGQLNMQTVCAYLDALTAQYPGKPVFLLLPIWREEARELRGGITLAQGRQLLAECAQKYPTIHVIDCSGFVPADPVLFYDGRVHPNDDGFRCYAQALAQAIRGKL